MASPPHVALMFDYDGAPYPHREIARGVHRWLSEHPGRWLLAHDPYAVERLGTVYQGLIGPPGLRLVRQMRLTGAPVVGATATHASLSLPRVAEGLWLGGMAAARHLAECGYHAFGFLGFSRDGASLDLERGFRHALHRRGLGCKIMVISRRYRLKAPHWARHRERLAAWLHELPKPVGIATARDVLALYLADLCAEKGLRVPHDVGIVGAGNDPALCLCPPRPLTSLDFGYEQIGHAAADMLDHLLHGGARPARNPQVRPVLVARESTGPTHPRDDTVSRALDYIREFAHRPLRVSHVARVVRVSQRHLVRRFRQVRQRTVVQEIAHVRLAHAESLLQATDLSAQAIARAVGLASDRHLARLFALKHGVTPGQWRRGRPDPPPPDRDALARAERLLAGTALPVPMVAGVCGYRDVRAFRVAFARRAGCLPGAYRQRFGPGGTERERPAPEVTVQFIGSPEPAGDAPGGEPASPASAPALPASPAPPPAQPASPPPQAPARPARNTRLVIPRLPRHLVTR